MGREHADAMETLLQHAQSSQSRIPCGHHARQNKVVLPIPEDEISLLAPPDLDDLMERVAEHDRCTRVVLCDVMPRLGELCDARDDLRSAVVALQERTSTNEASLELLKALSAGVDPKLMHASLPLTIGESAVEASSAKKK